MIITLVGMRFDLKTGKFITLQWHRRCQAQLSSSGLELIRAAQSTKLPIIGMGGGIQQNILEMFIAEALRSE